MTRFGAVNQVNSAIDLSFVSSDMATDCVWEVLEGVGGPGGSDHLPILIGYSRTTLGNRSVRERKIDLTKDIDWEKYHDILKGSGEIPETGSLTSYDHLVREIKAAALGSQKRKSSSTHVCGRREPTEWWDTDYSFAIRRVKTLTTNFRRSDS